MRYPSGVRRNNNSRPLATNFSNRGMTLEEDVNVTNEYYLNADIAVIHKKPTPIQIVNVHYPKRSAAVITEAYFQKSSTTDYNGIYRNKYIDFEVKETQNKTLFPLNNIHNHQMEHMLSVYKHGGICFIIIRFSVYDENYFIPIEQIIPYWDEQTNGKKSIPYKDFKKIGYLIPFTYQARVDYLKIINKLYFQAGGE